MMTSAIGVTPGRGKIDLCLSQLIRILSVLRTIEKKKLYSRGLTLRHEYSQVHVHSKSLSISTKLINMW